MKSILMLLLLLGLGRLVHAAALSNADVVRLAQSGLSDEVILQVIAAAPERAFALSAGQLVALKTAGVSDRVIQAMLGRPASRLPGQTTAKTGTAPRLTPDDVLVVSAQGSERPLRYLHAESRAAARALGWGGTAVYAVLPGASADVVLDEASPAFLLTVPQRAQPSSSFTLVNFAVRSNGTREVMVANGVLSVSVGITQDRIVPVSFTESPDQSRAPEGCVLYQARPRQPLAAGQYGWVCNTAPSPHGPSSKDQCYDFAISPGAKR